MFSRDEYEAALEKYDEYFCLFEAEQLDEHGEFEMDRLGAALNEYEEANGIEFELPLRPELARLAAAAERAGQEGGDRTNALRALFTKTIEIIKTETGMSYKEIDARVQEGMRSLVDQIEADRLIHESQTEGPEDA